MGVEPVRELSVSMCRLLYLGAGLAVIAGTQLFVGTEHTDRYFSWTIQSHLTAAFLGASYYSAIVLLFASARERLWVQARIAFFGLLSIAVLITVAMLIHIDLFHTDSDRAVTLVGTWAFIATYALLPPILIVGLIDQLRGRPGGDPPRSAPLPGWFRAVLAIQGAIMLILGAGLLIAPGTFDALWSWPLTPLTGRAIGAFVFSTGLAAALGAREDDWTRIRAPLYGYTAIAALEFVALARYSGEPSWSAATTWGYVCFLLSVLLVGLYGCLAAARVRRDETSGAVAAGAA